MGQRHYDTVVLGGTLSATIAAALIAKRGLRCLLVDQGELTSTRSGLLPDLVFSAEGSMVMDLVHRELGLSHEMHARLRPSSTSFQAIFPDERIDLPADRPGLVGEIRRAFGDASSSRVKALFEDIDRRDREAAEILSHSGPIPAQSFFAKRSAASLAKKHSLATEALADLSLFDEIPDELSSMFLSLLPFVSYLDATSLDRISVIRFVRPVLRFLRGAHRLAEDLSVRELFLEQAEKGRTDLVRSAVERVSIQGKMLELSISGESSTFTADTIIDASLDLSGLATLPAKSRPKALGLTLQEAMPKGHLHAVSIEVDRGVLPPGMADNLLLCNGRRAPRHQEGDPEAEDRPILLLLRGTGVKTPERARLFAFHPISEVRSHAKGVDTLSEVIGRRVERLIPFLPDGRPEIRAMSTGPKTGEPSLLEHPLYDPELDPVTGIAGVGSKTAQKNVFIAGPAVLPGLGAEGEYLAALQAADAAESLIRGTKPPKNLVSRAKEPGLRPSAPP